MTRHLLAQTPSGIPSSDPNPTSHVCCVCGAFGHSVPMSPRTHGDAVLYLCDDPGWCQVRAAGNVLENLALEARR